MAIDTFNDLVGRVQLRVPTVSRYLAQDWIRNGFRDLKQRRKWSWLHSRGQFLFPALENTGTADVTRASTIVSGNSTAFDQTMIGLQFRIGVTAPIYTIQSVPATDELVLDQPYGGSTDTAVSYEIYRAYVTVPNDFHSFISVYDPNFNWRLNLDYTQEELNAFDAQRSNRGNAYLVASLDSNKGQVGTVATPLQSLGSGTAPTSQGTYTGPNDAIFTIEITTGGDTGVADYRWKKDSGSYTSGVTTAATATELQDGVEVLFPSGTYVDGDIFTIRCTAGVNPGLPRYEIWPHITQEYVLPFIYEREPEDISVSGQVLPPYIDGNILVEYALAEAAKWPGPSVDKPNPYYRLELSDRHSTKYERLVIEHEQEDEETFMQDVAYQDATGMGYAPIPAFGDSDWLQKHGI